MINTILVIIYFLTALISLKIGLIIFYHFKKFDLPDNEKAQRMLSLFKWGSVVFLSLGFIFLILILIS